MAIEDTYSGATSAMTFMNAYIKTVAEEIGMDRALGLLTKMCESMGAMQGKMLKEKAGAEELDAVAAWSLVKTVPNLSYQLRKFRSREDDFCEEAIIQG